MSFTEKFFRKNLNAAQEKGTDSQKEDMAGYVAHTASDMGELGDFISGIRNTDTHPHHPINVLVNGAIDGFEKIVNLRREINGEK